MAFRLLNLPVLLYLLFLGLFSGSSVKMAMDVVTEMEAGKSFDVRIRVEKGNLESFARFQVTLPRGVTATGGSARNANYSFEGQTVRFVWMRLPMDEQFEINYTVSIDSRMRGQFDLAGTLSYIADNERQVCEIYPSRITIRPSPGIPVSQQLDIEEYQQSIPAQRDLTLAASQVRCVREAPRMMGEGNDRIVRLLVNREQDMSYAKIEETLPQGFTAEPIETRDGIFSTEGDQVKFLWMTLPQDPLFMVSYRLIPPLGAPPVIDIDLYGEFSYMQEETTRTIVIAQRDVHMDNMSMQDLERLVKSVPLEIPGSGLSGGLGGTVVEGSGRLIPQGPSTGGIDLPVQYRPIRSGMGGERGRRRAREISMDQYLLEPEQGVYYRVQVAAGHRPIDIERYFRRLSLHAEVRTERHEGWYKYSVGSFPEYKAARDYRNQVWATTPITDAFVAAYNNGERITVQEALMITSQKWYR